MLGTCTLYGAELGPQPRGKSDRHDFDVGAERRCLCHRMAQNLSPDSTTRRLGEQARSGSTSPSSKMSRMIATHNDATNGAHTAPECGDAEAVSPDAQDRGEDT
mmetsp:Transcript_20678/g.58665  ORF Transcript_20678/g.58665 Transcript_20678/m.58665 type:complete len:104 (+) Transcript_20678:183-494(+)